MSGQRYRGQPSGCAIWEWDIKKEREIEWGMGEADKQWCNDAWSKPSIWVYKEKCWHSWGEKSEKSSQQSVQPHSKTKLHCKLPWFFSCLCFAFINVWCLTFLCAMPLCNFSDVVVFCKCSKKTGLGNFHPTMVWWEFSLNSLRRLTMFPKLTYPKKSGQVTIIDLVCRNMCPWRQYRKNPLKVHTFSEQYIFLKLIFHHNKITLLACTGIPAIQSKQNSSEMPPV